MSAHTAEPWGVSADGRSVCDPDGFDIWTGILDDWQRHFPKLKHWARHPRASIERTETEDLSNAAHVVACVNACAGKNPEAFDDLLAAAEMADKSEPGWRLNLAAAIAKAKEATHD